MNNYPSNKKVAKLSPPWEIFRCKLKALFENDPDITVKDIEDNTGNLTLMIEVKNHQKCIALVALLPDTVKFGNVTLFIEVHDEENDYETDYFFLFNTLFADNTSVKEVVHGKDATGTEHVFVVFRPEVKQFYANNLFDLHGFWSGLNQDIAKEVFEGTVNSGVHFCTADVREN